MATSVALGSFLPAIATPRTVTFSDAVREHQDEVYGVALRITGDRESALDVMSSTFLKAYRALGRFRPGAPFRPWLLKIVGNEARNRRASAARHERLAVRAVEERREGDAVPSPEAALLDSERRDRLLAAIDRLAHADREVIACRYLLELTETETAAAIGKRVGTVKSRTSRALERLRAEQEAEDA